LIDGQKQIVADLHTHNKYSYDCHSLPARCYAAAVRNGVDIMAVTNHYDIDGALDGIYEGYDADADRTELETARKKYAGRLRIIRGVELGQAPHKPAEALAFLKRNNFDYVLLSLHNLRDVPDFFFWNHTIMTDVMSAYWFDRYFDQILAMLDFPRGDALAHLTYPYRYMRHGGRTVDFSRFRDKLAAIFKRLIERNMALEINTSGYRQGLDAPMPDRDIAALYRECGGELTVVGSDAHKPHHIGADIDRAYDLLRSLGFKYTCIPTPGGFDQLRL
jgi:histidinol phosphate phosphatase HisJ family